MIIIKLFGGLGNQLFQYAIGRNISLSKGVKLKIDIEDLLDRTPRENYTFRDFELEDFNIKIQVANKYEIYFFKLYHWLVTNLGLRQSYQIESKFTFDENILVSPVKSMYLNGFWQSEKYFSTIRPILINDLKLTSQLSLNAQFWQSKICDSNAVSVHIRRGDYILNSAAHNFHGVCNIDYYKTCIEQIKTKFLNCHFFFFSDDIEWAKLTFSYLDKTDFVTLCTNKEDLYLMSICRHNIIANSTFSWWGAWLNENENKIVYAPKRWFNDEQIDTSDLIPGSWERI